MGAFEIALFIAEGDWGFQAFIRKAWKKIQKIL
jgi:hypothetical protein